MKALDEARATKRARQLEHCLERHIPGATDISVNGVAAPRTGYSAETLMFDASWTAGGERQNRALVARLRPEARGVFPDLDIHFHFRILQEVSRTPVPVPSPLFFADRDESPFGEPFFVMERVSGLVPPENPPYTVKGWVAELDVTGQRRVFEGLVEQIAALHRVDWQALDLDFMPAVREGDPGMAAELRRLESYADWVMHGDEDATITRTFETLRRSLPPAPKLCLTWGDAKLPNILYQGTRPAALLDWELSTVSPPEDDLVFFLFYHTLITRDMGFPSLPGFLDVQQTLDYYEQLTGHRPRHVDWYWLYHLLRLDIIAISLTELLRAQGRIRPDATTTPHITTRRRLLRELDRNVV